MLKNSTYEDVLAYLQLVGGEQAVAYFLTHSRKGGGQRLGQAFMNALPGEDYARLSDSLYDPFYKDSYAALNAALDFLLTV